MHIFTQNRCLCIAPTPYHRDFLVSAIMIDPGPLRSSPTYGFWTRMHGNNGCTRSQPMFLQQILQSNAKRCQKQHTGGRNSHCTLCTLSLPFLMFSLYRGTSPFELFSGSQFPRLKFFPTPPSWNFCVALADNFSFIMNWKTLEVWQMWRVIRLKLICDAWSYEPTWVVICHMKYNETSIKRAPQFIGNPFLSED